MKIKKLNKIKSSEFSLYSVLAVSAFALLTSCVLRTGKLKTLKTTR